MNTTLGFAPEWNQFRRWWMIIAALLALLLLLLWFAGYGPGGAACKRALMAGGACDSALAAAPAVTAPVTAPTVAPISPPAAVAAAVAAVAAAPAGAAALPPAAKVYFALNGSVVPKDTGDRLKEVVGYLTHNPKAKAVVSGFHDPSGSVAQNEALALERARAMRSALQSAGIANERVVMQKPALTAGGGPPEEARRVEVSVRAE